MAPTLGGRLAHHRRYGVGIGVWITFAVKSASFVPARPRAPARCRGAGAPHASQRRFGQGEDGKRRLRDYRRREGPLGQGDVERLDRSTHGGVGAEQIEVGPER